MKSAVDAGAVPPPLPPFYVRRWPFSFIAKLLGCLRCGEGYRALSLTSLGRPEGRRFAYFSTGKTEWKAEHVTVADRRVHASRLELVKTSHVERVIRESLTPRGESDERDIPRIPTPRKHDAFRPL